jgi:hypothetical protein
VGGRKVATLKLMRAGEHSSRPGALARQDRRLTSHHTHPAPYQFPNRSCPTRHAGAKSKLFNRDELVPRQPELQAFRALFVDLQHQPLQGRTDARVLRGSLTPPLVSSSRRRNLGIGKHQRPDGRIVWAIGSAAP